MSKVLKTSVSKTLEEIKNEVEQRKLSLVNDVQKANNRELSELPEAFSKKEKIDYITKVQPHLGSVYTLVAKGFTKAKVAETLGVTPYAFRKMCKHIPELLTVLELGTEEKDDAVEGSLYQLALGYEVEEEIINPFDGTREKLTRYKDPVLGAVKYVLSNRRGEQYADKRQIVRKVELGADVKDALMAFKPEDLKRILEISDQKDVSIEASFEVRQEPTFDATQDEYEDVYDGEED